MLQKKQLEQIRSELKNCKRPVFFFHDDPDGVCSFLLFYRFVKQGKGIIIKSMPYVTGKIYAKKVKDYEADKIFVLDLAVVEQEFIDEIKKPVIWIDHHNVLERKGVKYYNTRSFGYPIPPSQVCYEVVKQDIWIAVCGCIGDWHLPQFFEEFRKKYPHLVEEGLEKPEDVLFKSKLGKLIRIISFNLKGTTKEAMDSVKIMTRINDPDEILEQKTPQGRYLYKRFERINKLYEELRDEAFKHTETDLVVFTCPAKKYSFTKDISNEISYLYPGKVVILGRETGDEVKLSLRRGCNKNIDLRTVLENALIGVEGYGGGHEFACGANVKKKDFKKFIENIKKGLKDFI